MRINVYTEEMFTSTEPAFEIATSEYTSSRTGEKMTNYGLRVYLKSAPELHYIPGRDDDRSAVTFWCGSDPKAIAVFIRGMEAACEKAKERLTFK